MKVSLFYLFGLLDTNSPSSWSNIIKRMLYEVFVWYEALIVLWLMKNSSSCIFGSRRLSDSDTNLFIVLMTRASIGVLRDSWGTHANANHETIKQPNIPKYPEDKQSRAIKRRRGFEERSALDAGEPLAWAKRVWALLPISKHQLPFTFRDTFTAFCRYLLALKNGLRFAVSRACSPLKTLKRWSHFCTVLLKRKTWKVICLILHFSSRPLS